MILLHTRFAVDRRATTIAAWVIWGTGLLLVLAGILLLFLNRSTWGNPTIMFTDAVTPIAIGLAYTSVGAFLFARFPRNAVAWVLIAFGLTYAFALFASEYAVHALAVDPGSLPAAPLLIWVLGPATITGGPFAIAALVLLYPDGRLRSRAWAALLLCDIVLGAITLISVLVPAARFDTQSVLRGVPLHFHWPAYLAPLIAFRGSAFFKAIDVASRLAFVGLSLSVLAGVVGLVWRLWRARGVERQQLKWLTFTLAAAMLCVVTWTMGGGPPSYSSPSFSIATIAFVAFQGLLAFGIPTATLIAITKYRLYDIDLIINRTLVYGFLAIVITAIYALIVVYIGAVVGGPGRFGLSLVATALIAIGFQPLRDRAQRLANRLVYGKRATPYEALSQLNEQIAGTYGGEEILDRMTRILAGATGAVRAELWVKRGSELIRTSAWPAAPAAAYPMTEGRIPEIAADKVLPVTHKGQLLGALALTKKRGESLSSLEEKLLADLASQAGLVLENAGLNRELLARLKDLQASRQRLVTAQDEERRRIERNLHDGAQQQVVALSVQLGLLERIVVKDPEKALAMAADLRHSAVEALETLRELAHGIYPPLLASDGLATALQQQVRRSPVPVDFEVGQIPRQPKEVEAATYFCCLEALQNMAKHAQATAARIRLWADEAGLHFEVQDNGRGFDAAVAGRSSGLQNMRDRMQALGGTLEVRSRPGEGTCIGGSIPLRQIQPHAIPAASPRPPSPRP
jgi:signal transduction histidine kinase